MSFTDSINEFLEELAAHSTQSQAQQDMLRALLERVITLAESETDSLGLRVAVTALDELLQASTVFAPWHDHSKITVFGSARTPEATPLYEMAHQLCATMTARGWLTVSGAGPGIMEAAAKGAGREHTLGVNIDLPFEQDSNPYIDTTTRLVEMKYFFTRKVALTRVSRAFAVFPGGLGTMDELFEILTLLHTGKTVPAPVALVDVAGGTYWEKWTRFMDEALVADSYIAAEDLCLVRICHSVDDVLAEIDRFYSNYTDFAITGDRGRLTVRRLPSPSQLDQLPTLIPKFAGKEGFKVEGDNVITFDFDGSNYVRLRLLIDAANGWLD